MYGGSICHPSQTGKTRQMQSICSADDIDVHDARSQLQWVTNTHFSWLLASSC